VALFLRELGPGLVTGAADDDPSGIATYSAAGARFGYGLLWTALFTLPLMVGVQLMCARVGLVAGRGLAAVLRDHYPRWVLWLACGVLLVANTINIGADLAGMAEALALVTGIGARWFVAPLVLLILGVLAFSSYRRVARLLKWLTAALFAYVVTAFLVAPPWGIVLRQSIAPSLSLQHDALLMLVAVLGTTISPYLFFWQAAQEVEEERALGRVTVAQRVGATRGELASARRDVVTGMFFSNLAFYFITLTCGATLHAAGITEIRTAADAAAALRPLAGNGASLLFALGIVGTGLLAVPVLAGSSAYAVADVRGWRHGIDERPSTAPGFYLVIAAGLVAGATIAMMDVDAMQLLLSAAVLNGVLATPLLVVLLIVCNDRRVMERHVNGAALNILGIATVIAMGAATVALLFAS
jgi:NRAMP (natural resistance-associated macrophage protein)-like metal ion transporter